MEFLLIAYLLIMAMLAVFSVYSFLFEWLPRYLKRRKATAAERATAWVNAHPIQPRGREI